MTAERRRFPGCDGLRAVAAGTVLFFHVATLTGLDGRSGLGKYFFQLDVGVDVFFVLSGFLLYRPFVLSHFRDTSRPNLGQFWKRRFFRIFPAYWVVFTVAWMLGFAPTFGLVAVDRETFERRPKASIRFLGGVATSGTLPV